MNRTIILFAVCTAVACLGFARPCTAAPITFDEVVLPANSALTNEYAAFGVSFSNTYYNTVG